MLSEKGQLLRTLAEHGNRKVAERLWHEWFKKASDTEVSILQKAQKELDLARPPHRGGVFLPLADKKGISGGLLVRVEFSDSPLGQEALYKGYIFPDIQHSTVHIGTPVKHQKDHRAAVAGSGLDLRDATEAV